MTSRETDRQETLAKAATSPVSYGRKGALEVRLARSPREIDAAQAVRYRVFYEEMSATPDDATRASKRDADRFDEICDHLLVVDHSLVPEGESAPGEDGGDLPPEAVVGCYRLLRQEVAERNGGFYTANEYDIAPLLARHADLNFLELGRSCVLKPYRNKPTVELLWHGIMHYVTAHDLDVMFGCASFEGTDPAALAAPLSYLHHHHAAPDDWKVRALPHLYVEMNRMAEADLDPREALRALPPMIKGYLRAGCYIGEGAVIDYQFGTTDVLILFPVAQISDRYLTKFGAKFGTPDGKA
ncbi:GNAT family N-acyltransferase [Parvibaculum sp.]|jgi:putative hemolysin|uniref:GNAT family N-acetyltransferase n=1 Tax=Parvibaculum sp. TaxID=2024848 RepID=UPI0025F9356F|nr:GNAT family N-acyltransferase [Parvibaculum sp.]|tara:strand:+ start:5086 stop:5982 length:897 start_codon:yes stop_codon:yes gene_type:complete